MAFKHIFQLVSTVALFFLSETIAFSQQQFILFSHLSTADGLSSPVVTDILQDRSGFLWIATNNGLNRYDGRSFETFRHQADEHSLIHASVLSICEDTAGRIWAGTSHGMSRFDGGTKTFQRFLLKPIVDNEELTNVVGKVYCDLNGTIWAGTAMGLFRFDATSNQFKGFLPVLHSSPGHAIQCILHDTINNGLWLAVNFQPAFFDFETEQFFSNENNPKHWKIFDEYHYSGMMAYTKEGFLIFNDDYNAKLQVYDFKEHRLVKTISAFQPGFRVLREVFLSTFIDPLNRLWTGNWGRHPVIIDWQNGTIDTSLYSTQYKGNMGSGDVNVIFVGGDGTYWIGTSTGIYFFNPSLQPFELYWLKQSTPIGDQRIHFILPGNDHDLWMESSNHLIHYDLLLRNEIHYPLEVNGRRVELRCLAFMSDHEIWIGVHGGLMIFNTLSHRFSRPAIPKEFFHLNDNLIQFVLTDSKENLWVGTWNKGVFLRKKNGVWKWFQHEEKNPRSLPYNGLLCITETHDGEIWIGMNSGAGLARYDPVTEEFDPAYKGGKNGLSNGGVNVLFEDHDRNLWVGTQGGGLSKLDRTTGQFTTWFDYNGLASNFVFAINEDEAGKLWITTAQGVSVLNPQTNTFTPFPADFHFTTNGLEPSGVMSKSGLLYFFKEDYFYEVDPSKNFSVQESPKAVLKSIHVFDQEIPFKISGDPLHLSYRQNFFSFEFAAPEFINPDKLQYSYLLENFDKQWNHIGNRNFASYTNVPPGDYVFKVKANQPDERGIAPETSIRLLIQPPFWKTIWFKIFTGFVIVAAVLLAFYVRGNLIRKEERKKAAYQQEMQELELKALRAQMNPHFIFNCMNSIQRYIYKNDQQSAVDLLQKFAALIRKILDNSEKKVVSLSEDIALLEDYLLLEQLRTEYLFDFKIEINNGLNADDIQVPSMLLQPFAENAIWHGLMPAKKKGLLQISITKFNHSLHCTIEDDGVGRNQSALERSKTLHRPKGLQNTQERLRLMADHLKSSSSIEYLDLMDLHGKACGTKVKIEIPLENAESNYS